MKKLLVVAAVLLLCTHPSHALVLDLITAGASAVSGAAGTVSDALFKQTMIAQTIQSVATLKKNYDESTSFYNEMLYISNNPNALLNSTAKAFETRGAAIAQSCTQNAERAYTADYNKPGVLGQFQAKEKACIKSNFDFSKQVLDMITQKETQFYQDTLQKTRSNNKQTVDEARLESSMLSTEALISLEKISARSLQTLNALYDQMTKGDRESFDREQYFQQQINDLTAQMKNSQQQQQTTSVDTLNSLLR
ncbi:MAG: hypothetical protein ABSH12_06185 [Endomicrobiales bacterium]|jgi:hypothetical protein